MNRREFHLVRGEDKQRIESANQLTVHMEAAAAASSGVVTLELQKGQPPKRWEKVVYPLLGLQVPVSAAVLAVYWTGPHALATFEDGEKEWVAKDEFPTTEDTVVDFKTDAGEPFSVPANDCIRREKAFRLFEEFFQTQKRPASVTWTVPRR